MKSAKRDGWKKLLILATLAALGGAAGFALAPARKPSADVPPPPGMVWIPGGEFLMGSDSSRAWPEESPSHRVRVSGFFLDSSEVTNSQFRRFVEATGHVTTAERPPDLAEIMAQVPPGTPPPRPEDCVPGSLVFAPPAGRVTLDDYRQWWTWTPGADWRHPEGPGSSIEGRDDHPVVQVSWSDAVAYARWAGKRLPTEAEWEFAARGGLEEHTYTWGEDAPDAGGRWRANLWQGRFPSANDAADGYPRTAPAKSFPANGFGLHDMAGNVWEWCADPFVADLYRRRASHLTTDPHPRPDPGPPTRVQRGGSFLCNDAYCTRYRPSARQGCSPDTGMSHVGFRCAADLVAAK